MPTDKEIALLRIANDSLTELHRATGLFGPFRSAHEGYGVMKEEFDELWDEIKSNGPTDRLRSEAIQLAAMAMRFVYDICDKEEDNVNRQENQRARKRNSETTKRKRKV